MLWKRPEHVGATSSADAQIIMSGMQPCWHHLLMVRSLGFELRVGAKSAPSPCRKDRSSHCGWLHPGTTHGHMAVENDNLGGSGLKLR